jgi:hypothetical protein
MYGPTTTYTFPTVTVDGDSATWSGGFGTVEDSWLELQGDESIVDLFAETVFFIPRDSFYDNGDGCYSVEITVIHNSPFGDDITGTSSQGWEFFWDYNEGRDTTGESPDPYKPPEDC